jgi:hypothetical protein
MFGKGDFCMSLVPYNICQGPATLYTGAFGTTEPADSAVASAPGAGWTDVGIITDGTAVLMEMDLTYGEQGADQLVDAVGARLTKRTIQVTASLAEATLTNLQLALNQLATINVQTGYSTLDPASAASSTQPTYTALLIDGWAPTLSTGAAARRRIIVRKTLTASKLAMEFEKSKAAAFACTWTAYYVSGSIGIFHVTDATA